MRRGLIAAAALGGLALVAVPAYSGERPDPHIVSAGNAVKAPAKGTNGYAGKGSGGRDPRLVYHGGPVVSGSTGTYVRPIYWGTSWTPTTQQVTVMQSFYGGVGGTGYLHTNSEYTDSSGSVNTTNVATGSAIIDNAVAPSGSPSTSSILNEVAKVITSPVSNGYYPVYVDKPRGNAGFCAWHSAGSINGVPVTFAFFFKLDGDPGCDPGSPVTTYSQGVAAVANVSAHELSEMLTDPRLNAWYDRSGYENSDKCAWKFNGLVSFGGHSWLLQGNWSNAAYNAHTGYDTLKGCLVTS